ncbi:chemotaxis protein CheW [Tsuneonella sp. HG222]
MIDRSLLIVTIAGEQAALDSALIQSVVELESITPVPRAPAHVAGLAALRSRAMTVIDCRRSLELAPAQFDTAADILAVVVEIEEYLYALIVDGVEEVVAFEGTPTAIRANLLPGWARAATGVVETAIGPALLLDPTELVSGPQRRAAA